MRVNVKTVVVALVPALLLVACGSLEDFIFGEDITSPDPTVAIRATCNAEECVIFCRDASTPAEAIEVVRFRAILNGVIITSIDAGPQTQASMDVSDEGDGTYIVEHEAIISGQNEPERGDDLPVSVTECGA